ncbi:MAG: hypothetical protein AVDCRST_MAG68-5082, partial [uncultured Gemmatimonadetes bacterium]
VRRAALQRHPPRDPRLPCPLRAGMGRHWRGLRRHVGEPPRRVSSRCGADEDARLPRRVASDAAQHAPRALVNRGVRRHRRIRSPHGARLDRSAV